jgi:hypothetical protein
MEICTSSSQQVHRYIPQTTIHFIECYFVFSPSRTQSSWNAYGIRLWKGASMASRQLSYTSIRQGFISQNMPSVAHCNDSQHLKHALLHWLSCTTRNYKQSIKVHVKFFKQPCHSIAFHTRYARNSITQCINPYQPLTIPSDLPMPQDRPTKATKIAFTDSQQMTASHWQ